MQAKTEAPYIVRTDAKPATTSTEESSDCAGPVCDAEYPLITPGEYTFRCVNARIYRHPGLPGKPWKCELTFRDGFNAQPPIFGFLNLGSGDAPHGGRTSHYWDAWSLANGGQGPTKRQVMSARIFKDRWFLVLVETVREKRKGKIVEQLPEHMHYSVVRKILARSQ
jgi:hypothetical protein